MEDISESEKSEDKSNLCRLCLGSTNVTVHIGQHVKNSTSIIEKIHYCTTLVVCLYDFSIFMKDMVFVNKKCRYVVLLSSIHTDQWMDVAYCVHLCN